MIKRIISGAIVLIILAAGLPFGTVAAQPEISVVDNTVAVEYPSYIIFVLEFESETEISDVRLNYRVERDSFVNVVSEARADFTPGRTSASWTWDMYKTGNPPPGTEIEYWWELEDETGNRFVTGAKTVTFDDHRHDWQMLEQGDLTLFWYHGSQAFAEEVMATAQESLVQLEQDAGAGLARPVDIYIYSSSQDLRRAMLYVQDWAGALAFTGYGVVAIGMGPGDMDWGKRAMVHELAHLVTHQMTHNPYNTIPVWLNEGISKYAEGELESYSEARLKQAVIDNSLISVQSLASPFSTDTATTHLSYAQSYSLVRYLIEEYGSEKMSRLLETFRQGSTYDDAFMSVYGFDINGLDDEWQEYIKSKYGVASAEAAGIDPVILILLMSGMVCIPLIARARDRRGIK